MSMKINTLPHRTLSTLWLIVISVGFAATVLAQAPIINPGAPGEPSKNLTAEEATNWLRCATPVPTCSSCRT